MEGESSKSNEIYTESQENLESSKPNQKSKDSEENGESSNSNAISQDSEEKRESPISREKSKASEFRFLEHKKKMKCTYKKTGHFSYMLFARALDINWGQDSRFWDWKCFKETGEDGIEVAKLVKVYWFNVRGEINTAQLSHGIEYEVFYVVKLKNGASGWELPVTLALSFFPSEETYDPKKITKCLNRQLSLLHRPRGEWFELSVGRFTVDTNKCEDILFDLYERSAVKKRGLVVQGAIIRPRVT